ncbi:MAG: hypothetical protein ABI700_01820 [Chloroflexota bacterium]
MDIFTLVVDNETIERSGEFVQVHDPRLEAVLDEGAEIYVRKEDLSADGFVRIGTLLYIRKQDKSAEFDALIDELIEEQAWLLNELPKR